MTRGASCAAGLALGCQRRRASTAEEAGITADAAPLRAHAAAIGVLYGAAVRSVSLGDKSFGELLVEQCDIVVPEGALKWDMLRPTPDSFDFAGGDRLLDYAQSHRMKLRGHCLVWHEALPSWFTSLANASNARKMMTEHIRTVVSHYAGKMHSWDVVNEVIEPGHKRGDGLTNSRWLSLVGTDYIDLAFQTAAEADPTALLVWNENLLEEETGFSRAKRHFTWKLLKELTRRGTPVQALGLQGHLHGDVPISAELPDFLARVADLGLKTLVTELDVRDGKLPADVRVRDQMVAEKYLDFLHVVLAEKSLVAVLTWGLSDRYSWLTDPRTQVRFKRRDNLPSRPLPFDADLKRKRAFMAMQRAFASAPRRRNGQGSLCQHD